MTRSDSSPRRFRDDFQGARWVGVRIRPGGFEIDGDVRAGLRGRVTSCTRARKLFEDGALPLIAGGREGIQSDEGVLCEACAHPRCRPLLRVHFADGGQVYLLDLPHSSARNLIRVEDELARPERSLAATEVVAEVVDRGHWGEVTFRVVL